MEVLDDRARLAGGEGVGLTRKPLGLVKHPSRPGFGPPRAAGTLAVSITYTLTRDNTLRLAYEMSRHPVILCANDRPANYFMQTNPKGPLSSLPPEIVQR